MKKHHLVYKTTNLINGKEYIGVHSTDDINDDYLGSGYLLILSVKKYGKQNFKREILKEFPSRFEAFKYESELLSAEYVLSDLSYNLSPGFDRTIKKEDLRRLRLEMGIKPQVKEPGYIPYSNQYFYIFTPNKENVKEYKNQLALYRDSFYKEVSTNVLVKYINMLCDEMTKLYNNLNTHKLANDLLKKLASKNLHGLMEVSARNKVMNGGIYNVKVALI